MIKVTGSFQAFDGIDRGQKKMLKRVKKGFSRTLKKMEDIGLNVVIEIYPNGTGYEIHAF